MAFCSSCGARLEDGANFCPECGAKVISAIPASSPETNGNADEPTSAPSENLTVSSSESFSVNETDTPENSADSSPYTPEITPQSYTYTPSSSANTAYSYDPSAASPNVPRVPRDIPGGMQTPKKRKSTVLIIVLGAVVLIALAAILLFLIGSRADSFEDITYNAVSGRYMGMVIEVDDMWEKGFSVELISRNKCVVTVNGESQTCRYEYDKDDGDIEIDLGKDEELEGYISGDMLYLENVLNTGVGLTFVRDDSDEPLNIMEDSTAEESTAEENAVEENAETDGVKEESIPEAVETESADWWTGDWYGWWIAYAGDGNCADLVDYAYDACATITLESDGSYLLDLWDEYCDKDENISYAYLMRKSGTTESGRLVLDEGYFYDCDLSFGDWVIDPGDSPVSGFDHMICIQGKYIDPNDSSSWMTYYVFLRPWGMSWEDVRSADTSDMPYDDMMPFGYDSWYAPLMDGDMPSYFDSYTAA